MTIRILLAEDHQMMSEGLRSLLEKEKEFEVLGEARNGRLAVQMTSELQPDIVIMDVGMKELNGIEATRQILARDGKAKILALSIHSETQFVIGMLQAGAQGYVLKDSAFTELAIAIRTILKGKTYLSPCIASIMAENYVQLARDGIVGISVLTNREKEILQLLAEGLTTRKIADKLNVSVKTVNTHRQHIMDKVNIHSIAGLTKYALKEGLTTLE